MKSIARKVTGVSVALALVLAAIPAATMRTGGGEEPVYAEKLISSKYALDMSKSDYSSDAAGLSNPYVVGVDGDKFENEIKYPAPSGAHVIEVEEPSYEFQDSTPAVQAALNEAYAYQRANDDAPVVVRFPAGKFYFYQGSYTAGSDDSLPDDEYVFEDGVNGRYAIFLKDRKNITLEGARTEDGKLATECLLFGENGFHFMRITSCENVRLVDLQLDYAELPFYFGEVVDRVDNKTLEIRTWEDYPVEITSIECYIEFDKDTNNIREAANNTYNSSSGANILNVEYVDGNKHLVRITFKDSMSTTPIGTKVALSTIKTAANMVIVDKSKDVYFETVYLYCGGGSVIAGYSNENLYFNRLMCVLKPGTDRLLSVAGDVIHVEDTKGDFVLSNSQLENTQDDGINVASHYMYPYMRNAATNSLELMYRGATDATYECNPGDVLAMMNTNSMKVIGYYQVESSVLNANCHYSVTFKRGGTAQLPSGETVELETDLSKVGEATDSIFSNITRSPVVLVENTVVKNKRNRGLLIQSRNVTVRNCEFSNVVNTAVMLIGEMESFCESTLPRDVVIRDCKFVNCDDNDIQIAAWNDSKGVGEAGAIEGVRIENNLFAYQQNAYSLYFAGVSDLDICHNWFYKPQTGTKKVGFDTTAIAMRKCADISFDGNLLDKFLPSRDGIFIWENVDVESFDWGENEGFDRRDVFGEAQARELAKSDTVITVDGKIGDWIKADATDIPIDNVTNVHIQKLDFAALPEGDFSATVKAFVKLSDSGFAADDGIYFYFDVEDDFVASERASWWASDSFELFLSTDTSSHDDIAVIKDDAGVETLQFALNGYDDGFAYVFPGRTTTAVCEKMTLSNATSDSDYLDGPIDWAFESTRKGYRGEVFIPFELLPVCGETLRSGGEIAIAFCFTDGTETTQDEVWNELMTFSNVPHPTCTANKVPATMVKYALAK